MYAELLVGCVGAAVAVLVWAEFQKNQALRALAKTLASLGFLALGWQAGLLSGSAPQRLILLGLVFGLLGDLLLLSSDKRWFLLGIGAFLLNHVAYVLAFLLLGVAPVPTAVATLLLAGIGGVVWRWLAPHVGRLGPAVMAYIVVIVGMVACSAGHVAAGGSWIWLVAAVLFFVSDLFVARQRFVHSTSWNRFAGLPIYYAAQVTFALVAGLGL